MTEQPRERFLDELARGLASGKEREPSRGGNQCLNKCLVRQ
jgi:hypothetical protein